MKDQSIVLSCIVFNFKILISKNITSLIADAVFQQLSHLCIYVCRLSNHHTWTCQKELDNVYNHIEYNRHRLFFFASENLVKRFEPEIYHQPFFLSFFHLFCVSYKFWAITCATRLVWLLVYRTNVNVNKATICAMPQRQ